jgi:hypothetical protein
MGYAFLGRKRFSISEEAGRETGRAAGQRSTLRRGSRRDDDRVGQIARAVMGVVIISYVEASSENGLAKKRRHHIRVGRQ